MFYVNMDAIFTAAVLLLLHVIVISSVCLCACAAHDDAIWTAAWGKSEKDGSETIITGSLDDMVKVWKW